MRSEGPIASSFRDPVGFLYRSSGVLYRQVNKAGQADYDLLMSSGLYDSLVSDGLLIAHRESDAAPADPAIAYKVIQPQPVRFISYPYEWCFSQLQDAALATLTIQKRAMQYGMSLKDASAFNIQWVAGRWTLIDTLSFERQEPGKPWNAYRQFCRHFLGPLALMSYRDARLGQLSRLHLDGVPLELTSAILPRRTKFSGGLLAHLHLHARWQREYSVAADTSAEHPRPKRTVSRRGLDALLDSLERCVRRLRYRPDRGLWSGYSCDTSYTPDAAEGKRRLVAEMLDGAEGEMVWDLGANVGVFSRLATARGMFAVAFDSDPACVERNYLQARQEAEAGMLPLVMDLTNPSASLGWGHRERMSLLDRGPADVAMALALVHHLALGNNVPLPVVADFFARLCRRLIIEFVPKEDPQVRQMLALREDIFPNYNAASFEQAFARRFDIERSEAVEGSFRRLYRMKTRP